MSTPRRVNPREPMVTVSLSYPFEPLILPQFVGQTLFPPAIKAGASAVVEPCVIRRAMARHGPGRTVSHRW